MSATLKINTSFPERPSAKCYVLRAPVKGNLHAHDELCEAEGIWK